MTREEWLLRCVSELRYNFKQADYLLPELIRVSCSWPSTRALSKKSPRVGEAWKAECSGDKHFEIFISPLLQDSIKVAATLVHELVHCAVGLQHNHNKTFRRCAVAMGLEGPVTATHAGEELTERLEDIIKQIGSYPHAKLENLDKPRKQSTRMKKVKCPECGYTVRTTRMWLTVGVPTCPCGIEMRAEETDEQTPFEEQAA